MALALLAAAPLAACGSTPAGPPMEHTIGLVYFAHEEGADMCMKGVFDGLKEQGIEEGVNLEVRRSHVRAEIANIPAGRRRVLARVLRGGPPPDIPFEEVAVIKKLVLKHDVARALGITFSTDLVQAAAQ